MKLQFVLNVGEIYGFTRKRMIDNSDPDIKPEITARYYRDRHSEYM